MPIKLFERNFSQIDNSDCFLRERKGVGGRTFQLIFIVLIVCHKKSKRKGRSKGGRGDEVKQSKFFLKRRTLPRQKISFLCIYMSTKEIKTIFA
jgi:hypothetical protein